MSAAVGLWLRRSPGLKAFPVMVAAVLLVVLSRGGWDSELAWALSWGNGSTILLSPLTAGVTAFGVWRGYPRPFEDLTRTTRRGARTVMSIAVAVWVLACVAWALGMVLVTVMTAAAGTSMADPDAWRIVTGPLALAAGAAVGAVLATALRSLAAAPLAVMVVYLAPLPLVPLAYPEIFWTEAATGPLGLTRPLPGIIMGSLAANLLIAGLAAYLTWRLTSAPGRSVRPGDAFGAVLAGCLVAVFVVFSNSESPDTHYWSAGSQQCAGTSPRVCLLRDGDVGAEALADQFSQAARGLEDYGLQAPDLVHEYTGSGDFPKDAAPLYVDTSTFRDGAASPGAVAAALARPRLCPEPENPEQAQVAMETYTLLELWFTELLHPDDQAADVDLLPGVDRAELGAWAVQVYPQLHTCDIDHLDIPENIRPW